jgi:hypothetical protein
MYVKLLKVKPEPPIGGARMYHANNQQQRSSHHLHTMGGPGRQVPLMSLQRARMVLQLQVATV